MDGEKLIEMLNDNFIKFLNEEYLVPFGWATLLNTYYHLEFVHDGSWDGANPSVYMPILQSKYKRRIERFKKLKNHQGHIFFMRAAYVNSLIDINRFYKLPENIEIPEDYALRLYEALKNYLPDVSFTLIIINNHEHENVTIEKRIDDAIMMVRADPIYNTPKMVDLYDKFFNELLQEMKKR